MATKSDKPNNGVTWMIGSKGSVRALVLLVLITLIGACGSQGGAAQPSPAAESGAQPTAAQGAAASEGSGSVEINWWSLTSEGAEMEALNAVIAEFEAANPGITVKREERSVDAHKEALRVALGTEAFPDIYFMWAGLGLGGEFVNAGASAPLNDAYTSNGWEQRFVPPALAAAKQYGDYQGVPEVTHGQALYYRKDLFEQAGITAEPTTYDELIAANDKLVAAGVKPIQFGGKVNWHLMRLLDNILETKCGAETHDALKGMQASWTDTPCATEAFTELKRWVDNYIVEDFIGIDNDESTQLWYAGRAAMALEGDWMVQNIETSGEDLANYGIFAFPTGTGRLYAFNEMNYVAANSPDKEAAIKFLDYLSSPEVQSKYLGVFGSTSVTQGLTPAAEQRPLDSEWVEILGGASGVFENGDQAFPLSVTTEYWRIMNAVAIGEIDPANAAAELQKFIDNQ
jgi:raffinose/stachyose/melibiose transport system substrate-binding protein